MAEPTVWALGEHTPGKHLVLQGYLDAWLAIMGMTQSRIIFIDGFAGPGEYSGGEAGSPIIALRALKDHAAKGRITAEVVFLFVENEPARIQNLERLIDLERPGLPAGTSVHVVSGKFDETITTMLDGLEGKGHQLAPSFLMADPFGVSDTPMAVIERLLRNDKSEVYVSFMYEAINRFKTTDEFAPHLDALFGCQDWRNGIGITDRKAKKQFFFDLYRERLKASGAKHVVYFELYKESRLVYAIFFGSKHSLGCDRMKQAIWKVAPFGDYTFRGSRTSQLGLEVGGADLDQFGRELIAAFGTAGWIGVEDVEEFSRSDRTDFHSSHWKSTLRKLEQSGLLEGDPSSRNRPRTYPPGTRVRFSASVGAASSA